MNYYKILRNGIVDQNPIFVQLISLCPLMAVTTSAVNAITMGIATSAVMIASCIVVSVFRRFFLNEIRIASFVVIVATLVTALQFILEWKAPPEVNAALGIYIPLIVVNCALFSRVEAFASKNGPFPSIVDAIGMGGGLTIGLLTVGIIREFLGAGSIFGFEVLHNETSHVLIMIMAPGGFFTLGTIVMIRKYLTEKRKGA